MRTSACLLAALIGTSGAFAGTEFGTEAEAREIAAQMVSIIQSGGVDVSISAMHDPAHPFSASQMGIHVFEDSVIVADNREPELIATSYVEVADLTQETMWPRIVAAAEARTDAVLEWYHYDTEAEYTYDCYSEKAEDNVIVMVCR